MKRVLSVVPLLALLLCGCGSASVNVGRSELYSQEELQAAVDVVLADFEQHESSRRLIRLEYDEELTLREAEYRAEHYGEEAVIVLVTDFYVKRSAVAVGALVPGSTCTDYQWILTRDPDGQWVVRDKGYG